MTTEIQKAKRDEFIAPVGDAKSLADLVTMAESQLAAASGRVLDTHRLARLATLTRMAAKKVPALLHCTKESIFWAMLDAQRCGLEWDGEHGALVPYGKDAKFIAMYRGVIDVIASESGAVATAFPVYRGEKFSVRLGTHMEIDHELDLTVDRSDDAMVAVYAVFRLPDGRTVFDAMSRAEIDKRRAVSRAAGRSDSPWQLWYVEMAKKTVIKHGAKLLPKLGERFRAVVEVDARADNGDTSLSKDEAPPERQLRAPKNGADGLALATGLTDGGGMPLDDERLRRIDELRKAAKLSIPEAFALVGTGLDRATCADGDKLIEALLAMGST